MFKSFDKSGIQLRYPQNWSLETEESDAGWAATFYSPSVAFMVLSLHEDEHDPSRVADGALAAMRESYADLEADAVMETIAQQPAIGYDIHFITLDLTNTCWIRCLPVPNGCLLILSQCTDHELDCQQPVFRAIQASLVIEET